MQKIELKIVFLLFEPNLSMYGYAFNGDSDAVVAAIPPAIGQCPI